METAQVFAVKIMWKKKKKENKGILKARSIWQGLVGFLDMLDTRVPGY